MGRAERVILFAVGFLVDQVAVMLWLVAVLTWFTVFQRFARAWRHLDGWRQLDGAER